MTIALAWSLLYRLGMERYIKILLVTSTLSLLVGCASVLEGTEQEVAIHSKPEGAQCEVKRNGNIIGIVDSTPGSVVVKKTKDDIHVSCTKTGFDETSYQNRSGGSAALYGNGMVAFANVPVAVVGVAVDTATGSDNHYDSPIYVVLNKPGQNLPPQHSEKMKTDIEAAGDNITQKYIMPLAGVTRDNAEKTTAQMRKWWLSPAADNTPRPVPASYCYHALQDVLCYRQPVAGWEHRLVAYQGTDAQTPPASVTEPLPRRAVDANKTPEKRTASAAPVFVNMPPEEKKADKEDTSTIDASHETLPDPALAPQL
jgi:hypothetical protein